MILLAGIFQWKTLVIIAFVLFFIYAVNLGPKGKGGSGRGKSGSANSNNRYKDLINSPFNMDDSKKGKKK